jgi:hypothetical protein
MHGSYECFIFSMIFMIIDMNTHDNKYEYPEQINLFLIMMSVLYPKRLALQLKNIKY